jgi:hypothetical protein
MLFLSSIERLRTADEPIAPNIESQQTVRCAPKADPFALPDFVGRSTVRSEPQRTGLTEVDPVKPAINIQGCAQPSRPPRQFTVCGTVSPVAPRLDRVVERTRGRKMRGAPQSPRRNDAAGAFA